MNESMYSMIMLVVVFGLFADCGCKMVISAHYCVTESSPYAEYCARLCALYCIRNSSFCAGCCICFLC